MKILVVSDTHGRWGALYNVIQAHSDAKVVIHLGDGYADLERIRPSFPDRVMMGVAGNCDFLAASGVRGSNVINIEGVDIFFTHGHSYRVKSGESLVEQAARARNAKICLYGHTHTPNNDVRNGLFIMNPGSIGEPRRGIPTCGIIEINGEDISLRIEECDI
ncbi:MAG: YfcE family phosphodiesterase [Ruminococcaceae bacterium]|nr:YfcE family phosphodiesterase [Oscillospiraceae bacterium]